MTNSSDPNTAPQLKTPRMLSGPILRRAEKNRLIYWFCCDHEVDVELTIEPEGETDFLAHHPEKKQSLHHFGVAEKAHIYVLDIKLEQALPESRWIGYDLKISIKGKQSFLGWQTWAPDICYPNRTSPGFVIQPNVSSLLHGSCRKPHHSVDDGLLRADSFLETTPVEQWPAFFMMSGDQVYVDDVAGPMLMRIHELIAELGFKEETLPHDEFDKATTLHSTEPHYYRRETLLPDSESDNGNVIFKGTRKPIFTSVNAQNHLVTLAEVMAMYLLVWSPEAWRHLSISERENRGLRSLTDDDRSRFKEEETAIANFQAGLKNVRRLMAHLSCPMIFDDHDITDDWNLTAAWEQDAYGHALSKRIIGNALIGYFVNQGLGNAPEQFDDNLILAVQNLVSRPQSESHNTLIDTLLTYDRWHYDWPTDPPLLVLDTRTHRWRSEQNLNKPSGLMDWEALTQLQQQILDKQSVILVSAAPVFGVKLIETIQRIFAFFGKPLIVDAENWMSHPGSANALLNIFQHSKTPKNFVILSGDVHYSFVYDIELRAKKTGPDIWQITSSGVKNEFPKTLLTVFDRLNRWLYSPRSPLNWFTKRRSMRVIPRKPVGTPKGHRLLNQSGVGLVKLNKDGSPHSVFQLCHRDKAVAFEVYEHEARWE